jgi:hypothetical protein
MTGSAQGPGPTVLATTDQTGRFVLGYGAGGTFGHVEVRASSIDSAGACDVSVAAGGVPHAALEEIRAYALAWLTGYVEANPSCGLRVVVTRVVLDPLRRNELERATYLALHLSVIELGLPPPALYEAPDAEPGM